MPLLTNLQNLLLVSCGTEFLILFFAVELILFLGGAYLLYAVRHQHALAIYLPLTTLPLFLGGLRSLLTLSTAVALLESVHAAATDQPDGMMLIGLSAGPLLLGIVLTAPAFTLVTAGRATMTWWANRDRTPVEPEAEPKPGKSNRNGDSEPSDADDYITQLTRNRR